MRESWRHGGFGLYIHWPFCEAKCPYCDFNSYVERFIDQERWQRAYVKEIERAGRELPDRLLNSIFIGGGTPSLMDPDTVGEIVEAARRCWPTANDLEVTLEANPSSVEAGKFAAFKDAGINRVSVGVQALNDRDLRALGRLHSAAEAKAAIHTAQSVFDRVSFDLIYARQNQTLDQWRAELGDALKMASGHMSLYQLTIEDGTAFGDRYRRGGLAGLPEEDLAADLFLLTQEMCSQAGYSAYEISNHALADQESRHNLIYWRAGDYVGIGPGAHGRLTINGSRYATLTPSKPGEWLRRVEADKGELPRQPLSDEEQAQEYLLMSMRLIEGTNILLLKDIFENSLNFGAIDSLKDAGLVTFDGCHLKATDRGRPVLNGILREILC